MFSLLLCHCSHLTDTTLIIIITACSTQLFVILLTTATLCLNFTRNLSQGCFNYYWTHWSLYLVPFIVQHIFSLTSVLELEGSRARLLENSNSLLIANQIKTNMCSQLNSLLLSLLLCHCSHLTDTTIIITITACPRQLHTQRVTRLFGYKWLTSAMSCPFIVQQNQSNERSWTGRFAYSTSRELYCDRL